MMKFMRPWFTRRSATSTVEAHPACPVRSVRVAIYAELAASPAPTICSNFLHVSDRSMSP